MSIIELARQFLFVREYGGPNRGFWVEWIQHFTGNQPGDSWCASFVSMLLALTFQGKSKAPLSTTAVVQELYDEALHEGWVSPEPRVGDLFCYLDAAGHAHHTGFVTGLAPLTGIAGNTSADGTSSNGDRVAEHPLHVSSGSIAFIHYPRPATPVAPRIP